MKKQDDGKLERDGESNIKLKFPKIYGSSAVSVGQQAIQRQYLKLIGALPLRRCEQGVAIS